MVFDLLLTIFKHDNHKKYHIFTKKKMKNIFHSSNRYVTKELVIWTFSIPHWILNFKTLRKKEKTENVHVILLPVCQKKYQFMSWTWFVISSLRNVTIKADSFEIITMVRYFLAGFCQIRKFVELTVHTYAFIGFTDFEKSISSKTEKLFNTSYFDEKIKVFLTEDVIFESMETYSLNSSIIFCRFLLMFLKIYLFVTSEMKIQRGTK